MYTLNSDITIGSFRFTGVSDVKIARSMYILTDTATIKLPAKCSVKKKNRTTPLQVLTTSLFKEGDPVTISLGYNNQLHEEFKGFVKLADQGPGSPVTISCEGYSYQTAKNNLEVTGAQTVKELAQKVVSGIDSKYPITVQCDLEGTFSGLALSGISGNSLLAEMKKASGDALYAFFIEPGKLWVGLPYTLYTDAYPITDKPLVKFKPGFNTPTDNTLQIKKATDNPTQVTNTKKAADGKVTVSQSSAKPGAQTVKQTANQLSAGLMEAFAKEKALRLNYNGYAGKLTCFLQPFVLPGQSAFIKDINHPDMDGTYLVESTEVSMNEKGARRIIEVGARLGGGIK